MTLGESPVECARRECFEETGMAVEDADIHVFAYVAEKNYEGASHWLMFLAQVLPPIAEVPPPIGEGHFAFFKREEIAQLQIPETDHQLVWPFYDQYRNSFVGVRADCSDPTGLNIAIEVSPAPFRKNH